METTLKLKCPNCSQSFLPTEAIWQELKTSIQSELHDEIASQRLKLQEEKDNVQRLSFELSAEKQELEKTINLRLKDRESALREIIEEQLSSEKNEELQLLEEELIKKSRLIAGFNKQKREMIILQKEMEEKESEIHLRYQMQLADELDSVKVAARAQAVEESVLALRQKEKVISDLKNQLEIAKTKVDAYSSQLVGETQELFVESVLREIFPQDNVLPVPKGISGADTIMEIMVSGSCVARLLLESKNVRGSFNKNWITKLHEDNRHIGAQAMILVVKNLPKELEGEKFGIIDNVFITTITNLKPLIILLRYSALRIAQVIQTHKGKESKESLLFEFITSQEFATLSQSVINQLDSIKANFDAERKKVIKLWGEREKMLEIALLSTVEYFGKLHGITSEVKEIDSLEIRLPKAG